VGYIIRQIEKRARALGHIPALPKKAKRVPEPTALALAFTELAARQAKERRQAVKAQERTGTWDKIRTRLGGLFRRKV